MLKKSLLFSLLVGFNASIKAQNSNYCDPNGLNKLITGATVTKKSNVSYGTALEHDNVPQNLVYDFHYINNGQKKPLVVLVHGGGFYVEEENKTEMTYASNYLARRGYAVANIEYRVGFSLDAPGSTFTNEISKASYRAYQDIANAINVLYDSAEVYQIDTNALFLGGFSAGAVTALNYVYTDPSDLDAIGLTSLLAPLGPLPQKHRLAGAFSLAGALPNRNFIDQEQTPVLFMHGNCDETLPIDTGSFGIAGLQAATVGSNVLTKQLQANGLIQPFRFEVYKGLTHNDMIPDASFISGGRMGTLMNYLKQMLCGGIGQSCNINNPTHTACDNPNISLCDGITLNINTPLEDALSVQISNTDHHIQITTLDATIKLENISLFNLNGQVMYQGTSTTMNTKEWNSGLYILHVQTSKGRISHKIVLH